MFVDVAKIHVRAGKGGDGAVSFLRDRNTAFGGPDGGNGGDGGSVVVKASKNLSTLSKFRYKKLFSAEDGKSGGKRKCTGKSGEDLVIYAPIGTLVKNAVNNEIMYDISDFQPKVIARGGRGGLGNMNFCTSVRQSPRFAKPGKDGEEFEIILELKLLADVALVGFPNVGKSTLLSIVSNAKPQIANYHFTTLSPILGIVNFKQDSLIMADIPGLIEGASKGIGLGHEFLRHIERCRLLVHIVDISGSEGRNPVDDFEIISNELKNHCDDLTKKPFICVANKCDVADEVSIADFESYLKNKFQNNSLYQGFFRISCVTTQGINEFITKIFEILPKLPEIQKFEPESQKYFGYVDSRASYGNFEIKNVNGIYKINSKWLENLLDSVNFDDSYSRAYFQEKLDRFGVNDTLRKMGAKNGDTVKINDFEFEFFE